MSSRSSSHPKTPLALIVIFYYFLLLVCLRLLMKSVQQAEHVGCVSTFFHFPSASAPLSFSYFESIPTFNWSQVLHLSSASWKAQVSF